MKLVPVILSGGSGTRLWPLSRKLYPKQLLPLVGNDSLFQSTLNRLKRFPDTCNAELLPPLVVCNEEHRFLIQEQAREAGFPLREMMLEREGRNTAPALTLAALEIQSQEDDALLLVMPADHIFHDEQAFAEAVDASIEAAASQQVIATFGIKPDSPHTGYGYIRAEQSAKLSKVAEFVEKPDLATAESYLNSGDYFWNSGIFLVKASVWLKAIAETAPEVLSTCKKAHAKKSVDNGFVRVDEQEFVQSPNISIDYAVMEPITRESMAVSAVVMPLDAGWSDLGSWSSVCDALDKDDAGNSFQGDVVGVASQNNMALASHRMVAMVGMENTIVIETADAVLVVNKEHAQSVKKVVEQLALEKREEHLTHRKVYRPWGSYEGIDHGERFQVKRISVNPGATLSLQKHHHRAEHWVVVRGTAEVTRGEEVFLLTENQSVYIPIGELHRLKNPGKLPLDLIEVQSGAYLGEDDIVRFEDVYGRQEQRNK